ncbi:MAG: hypothetical protein IJY58_05250 [Alphaproteobacteria bacterium]|nr:hypothetical protein [Alphaproteobacteria bacterium]MBQ9090435.1 hypothetical protein [Alphaproteobacteria bacterium]
MLKQTLLVAGILSIATAASALESTNPFFGPAKNTVASTTTYDFETTTVKTNGMRAKSYNHYVAETLQYGLTDSVSLDATVSNTFAKTVQPFSHTDRADKNIDFEVGSTWNVLTGPAKLQVKGAYGQKESNSHDNLGAYKYVLGGVKAGYTMGIYTPYVSGTAELPVAQSERADNHYKYEGKAGVYAYCPRMKTAVDTGVRVNYDETTEARTFAYDLEVSYFITKNWAISAFGSYTFDGKAQESADIYGNKVGLKLRTAF